MRVSEGNRTGLLVLTPLQRRCLGAGFVLMALGIFLGAVSIPFIHESWTIKYKFGLDRIFLRTGQMLGAAAGILMIFHFVLSGRLMLLDRIFAVNRLYRCHRVCTPPAMMTWVRKALLSLGFPRRAIIMERFDL